MRAFEPHHPRLRVVALVVCAVGAVVQGLVFGHPAPIRSMTVVDGVVPMHVWAIVWIAAGAAMVVGIWHRVVAHWTLSLGAALWAVWSLAYLMSWLAGESPLAWAFASAFGAIAGLMWIVAALADSAGPRPVR